MGGPGGEIYTILNKTINFSFYLQATWEERGIVARRNERNKFAI